MIATGDLSAYYPAFLPDGRVSFQAVHWTGPNQDHRDYQGFWIVGRNGSGLTRLRSFTLEDTMGYGSADGSLLPFTTHATTRSTTTTRPGRPTGGSSSRPRAPAFPGCS